MLTYDFKDIVIGSGAFYTGILIVPFNAADGPTLSLC